MARLSAGRANFETMWEGIAEVIWPNQRMSFKPGKSQRSPGIKDTQLQFDSTPQLALGQFAAILDSLLTPANSQWHRLTTTNPELNKVRAVREWYEAATTVLFGYRTAYLANFPGQNQGVFKSLGAFGTGVMYLDKLGTAPGLRYKTCTLGEVYLKEGHQGIVQHVIRYFPLTPAKAAEWFGAGSLSPAMQRELAMPDLRDQECWFIHCVKPQAEYFAERLDSYGKKFVSHYVDMKYKWLIQTAGYNTFPYLTPRYEQAPGEVYGRSPAMQVLPSINTLQMQKRSMLKAGQLAVDPVLLIPDDGILDEVDRAPGSVLRGGTSPGGNPMVSVLPSGRLDMGIEMMDEERKQINAAFLVHLFQILTDTPTMTATEVIERTREKGILLAPTVGRQQSEYLGPMIDRELDVLMEQRLLPPMPPELLEANGEYEVAYENPLSRVMRAEKVAGGMRTLDMAAQVATATGDATVFDVFDFDTIIPEVGDINGMPVTWTKTEEALAALREQRAQAAERDAQTKEAGPAAALLKAGAAAKTAGMTE
jgi:hypothetical protein